MAVAGHKVIGGIADHLGHEAAKGGEPEGATEVVRDEEGGIGSKCDDLAGVTVLGAEPNHGVNRLEFGVARTEIEPELSMQGRETERVHPLSAQDGLYRRVAEAARVVEEENGLKRGALGQLTLPSPGNRACGHRGVVGDHTAPRPRSATNWTLGAES